MSATGIDGPKVVVIGGGFAGLNVIQGLKKFKGSLLLIDRKNHHLFQPLLYQVATAALSPANIATPLRQIFSKQANATVIMATVESIVKERRQVILANGEIIHYDYLVLAPGANHSYFGHDRWEKIAPGLKTISDALKIRERILMSFEEAERLDHARGANKFLNFVIVGAGPTGVEMAGAIAEITTKTLFRNFRHIKPEESRIYLIDGANRVLPGFPEDLSAKALQALEKMGVTVILNHVVTDVTTGGVQVGSDFIETCNVIWAAGNQAAGFLKTLDVPLDRQGRVIVGPDLIIPGHSEVFVIGDAAACFDKDGAGLPAVAPVAIQQGRYVAKLISQAVKASERKPFHYFDKGGLATIGRNKAVGYFGKFHFSGLLAWLIWGGIHVVYLVNFRSRISVMVEWIFHYTSGIRSARLIQGDIDEGLKDENKNL